MKKWFQKILGLSFCDIFGHDIWIVHGTQIPHGKHQFKRYEREYCRNPGCKYEKTLDY